MTISTKGVSWKYKMVVFLRDTFFYMLFYKDTYKDTIEENEKQNKQFEKGRNKYGNG